MGGEILYRELSYQLVGCAFRVFKEMGYGHHERNYQRGYKEELEEEKLLFQKEYLVPVLYKKKQVGKYFLDFLVENKIIVEIKVANQCHDNFKKQVLTYLNITKKRLGIIFVFTPTGVIFERVVL